MEKFRDCAITKYQSFPKFQLLKLPKNPVNPKILDILILTNTNFSQIPIIKISKNPENP
jgi:hypothetical protein